MVVVHRQLPVVQNLLKDYLLRDTVKQRNCINSLEMACQKTKPNGKKPWNS